MLSASNGAEDHSFVPENTNTQPAFQNVRIIAEESNRTALAAAAVPEGERPQFGLMILSARSSSDLVEDDRKFLATEARIQNIGLDDIQVSGLTVQVVKGDPTSIERLHVININTGVDVASQISQGSITDVTFDIPQLMPKGISTPTIFQVIVDLVPGATGTLQLKCTNATTIEQPAIINTQYSYAGNEAVIVDQVNEHYQINAVDEAKHVPVAEEVRLAALSLQSSGKFEPWFIELKVDGIVSNPSLRLDGVPIGIRTWQPKQGTVATEFDSNTPLDLGSGTTSLELWGVPRSEEIHVATEWLSGDGATVGYGMFSQSVDVKNVGAPATVTTYIPDYRYDTNRSGTKEQPQVTPIDVLNVVNVLNKLSENQSVPDDRRENCDVNGDGQNDPIDALLIVNYINNQLATVVSGTSQITSSSVTGREGISSTIVNASTRSDSLMENFSELKIDAPKMDSALDPGKLRKANENVSNVAAVDMMFGEWDDNLPTIDRL